jgi:hypothetical protein
MYVRGKTWWEITSHKFVVANTSVWVIKARYIEKASGITICVWNRVDKSRAIPPPLCINRTEILKASKWLNVVRYLGAKAVDGTVFIFWWAMQTKAECASNH